MKSAWEWTVDPWMDAAHRGTVAPEHHAAVSLQARATAETGSSGSSAAGARKASAVAEGVAPEGSQVGAEPEQKPKAGADHALIGVEQSSSTQGEGEHKARHVDEGVGTETDGGLNGHLDEWHVETHTVNGTGPGGAGPYTVTANLDLHTKVYIWPENTAGRWNEIADFAPYYGGPYDPGFNMYQGTLNHENQHVVEAVSAYNGAIGAYNAGVAAISAATAAAAEAQYQAVWSTYKAAYKAAYWASGEALGYAVEWRYYHTQFDAFLADPLSYGLFDWCVTDGDANKVAGLLEKIRTNGNAGALATAAAGLKANGVLARLADNLSAADKATYANLLTALGGLP
ncbi:hypothetical protein [Haliangium sp.]|uniref:hypothetical protein n=1 Tax=Haliangium sp. TaxID=2663208 RepID=UPI003D0CEDF8